MTLSKDTTTAMKGLLILLIVIGHNHEIASENSSLMSWLYSFHVLVFFILPFFYAKSEKNQSFSYILTLIVRNWVPYFFTTLVALLSTVIYKGAVCVDGNTLFAFLNGSTSMTGGVLGAIFLWFLPTFCSFSILILLADRYRWLKPILFLAGLICWGLSWSQFEWLKIHALFGIPMAVKCYSLGLLAKYIVYNRWSVIIGSLFFIVLSVFHFSQITSAYSAIIWPISAFCCMLLFQKALHCRLFLCLGKYSLLIYLIHVFIYQFLNMVLPNSMLGAVLNLLLTLLLSGTIAWGIQRIYFLRKLYTPRNWSEFIVFYKR